MRSWCVIHGPRIVLRPFEFDDALALTELQRFNRAIFTPVMPERSDIFFTAAAQGDQIQHDRSNWLQDAGYAFAIVTQGHLVGRVALSNVVRGAWQNATLGYWVDSRWQGRGLATESVCGVLLAAFEYIALHRIQAAIMPSNGPSLSVIAKSGFREEGLAPRYLQINGRWEDHRIFSLTAEHYEPAPGFWMDVSSTS